MDRERLPLSEAARLAGVTDSALRHAIRSGRLPAERFGPIWTVTRADLDAYLASKWADGRGRKRTAVPTEAGPAAEEDSAPPRQGR